MLNKGRKVPLDWLVDVIPVPSGSKGCLADGERMSPNGVSEGVMQIVVHNHKYVILLPGWCCLGSTEKNTLQPLRVLVRHDHFEKKK